MVEINNQRAVPRYAGVVGGNWYPTSENQKSWLWRSHCRRMGAIYRLLRSPSQTCHAKPKLKSTGADATSFFPLQGIFLPQLGLKDFSEKSQDAVALQQIGERGALPMIDRGDIRRAIDRCSNIWASLPGVIMARSSIRLTAWLQNSKKRAERSVRDWCMSRVTAIISALVICIIVRLSWAVNHYRDNAITYKAQREMPENWKLANAVLLTCMMRQRDVAALDAKYTKELADAKAEIMLCVMMLPLVVVGCTSKQSVSQCVKPPPPPAWIMQPPLTGRHRWTGLFLHQREADHYAKTTGRNPEVY